MENFQNIKEVIGPSIMIMLIRLDKAKLQLVFVRESPNQQGYLHKIWPSPCD